jgi:hypothetical protein
MQDQHYVGEGELFVVPTFRLRVKLPPSLKLRRTAVALAKAGRRTTIALAKVVRSA